MLKDQLEPKLHDPGLIQLAGYLSELGISKALVGWREAHGVRQVEELATELQPQLFVDLNALADRHVDVPRPVGARAAERPRRIAVGVGGRRAEGRGIEPAVRRGIGEAGLRSVPVGALAAAL